MNLVVNARDALSPDGSRIDVRLAKSVRAGSLRLSVTDDGRGIPAALRERVFEAFYTTKTHGTGLGMAIAKQSMEKHRGTIQASPSNGGGAEFIITILRAADRSIERIIPIPCTGRKISVPIFLPPFSCQTTAKYGDMVPAN